MVRDNVLESDNPGKPVVEVGAANAAKPVDVLFEANTIRQLADGDGIRILQAIGPVTVRDNPEISGTGTGTGIKYNLEASDGITRGAVESPATPSRASLWEHCSTQSGPRSSTPSRSATTTSQVAPRESASS